MPEIEARLKAKCDRLVSAFEIDEAGECHMYLIRDYEDQVVVPTYWWH